jgi:cytochrome c nitrite reductase small subunit
MMSPASKKHTSGMKKTLGLGVLGGVILTLILVLASGFMVEATNTDRFCVTCHAMKPFRTAWENSVHGGNNPRGVAAQCVDCHLPHGNFVEYIVAKGYTGSRDVYMNLTIDTALHDWAGRTKFRREFTYDNACRQCHLDLQPKGMKVSGILAHAQYLNGSVDKHCVDCHEHVGHKDMLSEANEYFLKVRKEQ